MKTNAKGSWYTYTVTKERAVKNMAEYDRGQALHNAFASGDKKIDDEMMDAARGGAAQGDLNNEEM
jgi:hypothetical protein